MQVGAADVNMFLGSAMMTAEGFSFMASHSTDPEVRRNAQKFSPGYWLMEGYGINFVVDMSVRAGRLEREATPPEQRKHWAWLGEGYTMPRLVPDQRKSEGKVKKAPSNPFIPPMILPF